MLEQIPLHRPYVTLVHWHVLYCIFQIPIHTESTKFVKLSVSLISALVEQGMFYWFGGEMLEEVWVLHLVLFLMCGHLLSRQI
jgi:hypothetical protein